MQQSRARSQPYDAKELSDFWLAFHDLAASWERFFENFGINETAAVTELATRSEPLAQTVVQEMVPRIKSEEQKRVEYERLHFYSVTRITRFINLVVSSLSLLIAFGVAFSVSRYVAAEVGRLKQGALALAQGNLEHRIDLRSHDELGQLTSAFNHMADRLGQSRKVLVSTLQELQGRKQEVEAQKKVADNLLLNILPAQVAAELREKGSVTARFFEDVTILLFTLSRAGEMVYTARGLAFKKEIRAGFEPVADDVGADLGRLDYTHSATLNFWRFGMPKSLLSISLSLLLAATPLYAAPTDNQTAGEVKALIPAASRNAQPVKVKDSLEWNDLLKTGAQGRLRADLTAGSILSLGSNSELQVVQHDAVSQQTSLVVNYGKLRNQVGKITKPDGKYEVRTPNAVIGVIGTDFYVGYANRRTTVICYVGKVAVTPAAGVKVLKSDSKSSDSSNTVTLVAGEMVVIGLDIPLGGYQATLTPAAVAEASMQDTNVPDQPVSVAKVHPHRLRKVLIGLGMAAGLGLGLGIAEMGGGGHSRSSSSTSPQTIDLTNQYGTITFTDPGLISKGSQLVDFNGITPTPGHALGSASFSTGRFTGTSIWTGGTFSSVGSTFDVTGVGAWAKQLTGQSKGPVTLYSGGFVGPIDWTVVSHVHDNYVFTLSGTVSGKFYTGQTVTGTTKQTIYAFTDQEPVDHTGGLHMGSTSLTVPQPGKGSSTAGRSMRPKLIGWKFVW